MYKYLSSDLQTVFSDYFGYNYDCRNHNTRSSLNFSILCSKQVLYSFSISNTGSRLWNLLSYEVKSARSLAEFKTKDIKNLISLSSSICMVLKFESTYNIWVFFSFLCVYNIIFFDLLRH